MFNAVRGLAAASRENLEGMKAFQEGLEAAAKLSRELRPSLGKIRQVPLGSADVCQMDLFRVIGKAIRGAIPGRVGHDVNPALDPVA